MPLRSIRAAVFAFAVGATESAAEPSSVATIMADAPAAVAAVAALLPPCCPSSWISSRERVAARLRLREDRSVMVTQYPMPDECKAAT